MDCLEPDTDSFCEMQSRSSADTLFETTMSFTCSCVSGYYIPILNGRDGTQSTMCNVTSVDDVTAEWSPRIEHCIRTLNT